MKELTIEEKAQRYDEAIKKLKIMHDDWAATQNVAAKKVEEIFPELKESESGDEKIMKSLSAYFARFKPDDMWNVDFSFGDIVAWLEKQSEQKKSYDTCDSSMIDNKKSPYGEKRDFGYFEEKPTDDKVESKFHVGEWIITNKNHIWYVDEIPETTSYLYRLINQYGKVEVAEFEVVDNVARLWTIQDAKDGDVLYSLDSKQPFIFKHRNPNKQAEVYCGINIYGKFFVGNTKDCIITTDKYVPATKEQRDTLMKAMTDAGYIFDFEKKELKKIHVIDEGKAEMDYCFTKMMNGEKVSSTCSEEDEEYNGEDYGIDSLYHAQRILEKTLGKVDGYQTDDGILSHQCAITAVKKLYEQKPAEWSEEDENKIDTIISVYRPSSKLVNWLKSLKERYTWKPSKEQIEALHDLNLTGDISYMGQTRLLIELYNDLKKLTE